MSLLFVGYNFEKIDYKKIKQMLKKEGEEVDNSDDFYIANKGIFAIADSAITSLEGTKPLLTGFRKVYDMEVKLWKPSFLHNGFFQGYLSVHKKVNFIVGFAGSTLVAQHILNSISGHLENLKISCKESEHIEYIIKLHCEKNLVISSSATTAWSDDTFLDRDFNNLLSGEYIAKSVEHSINHALKSAKKYRLNKEEFQQMYTDIFCGFYCPILKEHQIYIYRMKSKLEEGILEVYTEKEKLEKNDIAVLGMRNRYEKKAKDVFAEEYEKDNPNVTKVLIDLMNQCIEKVHKNGSFEIDRPIVYKSLDEGIIKKVNIYSTPNVKTT